MGQVCSGMHQPGSFFSGKAKKLPGQPDQMSSPFLSEMAATRESWLPKMDEVVLISSASLSNRRFILASSIFLDSQLPGHSRQPVDL